MTKIGAEFVDENGNTEAVEIDKMPTYIVASMVQSLVERTMTADCDCPACSYLRWMRTCSDSHLEKQKS